MLFVDLLVFANQLFQLLGGQVGVLSRAVFLLDITKGVFEVMVFQSRAGAHYNVTEHVNKTAVTVPAGSWIASSFDKALDRLVVHTQVQNGVHHAGHRLGGTRTNRNQKWVF